ncbi:MAG: hypothetical protein K2H77_05210, partial [Alistipes sp.]|nr:hypothetical protein [Alistipes sp.]
ESTAYRIGAYAAGTDDSASSVVLTVDTATKQLKGLQSDVEVVVGSVANGQITSIVGVLGMYYADGTTIEPYVEAETSAASLKMQHAGPSIKVPYRSVADMRLAGMRNTLKSSAVEVGEGIACPVRTLSVKPERCEPSPKTFGRVATFELVDNARLAK